MSFVVPLFNDVTIPKEVREEAVRRNMASPGIPKTTPPVHPATSSFWISPLNADANAATVDANDMPLPAEIDIVIIGSGITGTSVARQILRSLEKQSSSIIRPRILMVDARAITSGATGRNGGHFNETGFAEYLHLKNTLGKDAAIKITVFRLNHLKLIMEVATDEKLVGGARDSQARVVESHYPFFDEETFEQTKIGCMEMKEDLGDIVSAWRIVDAKTAWGKQELEQAGFSTAHGSIVFKAGAVWPYRLVTGIQANLLRDHPGHFAIRPHMPVTSVSRSTNGFFLVQTDRGAIKTKHVVHATNSHLGHLLPEFRGRVLPVRGQMSAQTPPFWFPHHGEDILNGGRSWCFEFGIGFDYITQLPRRRPDFEPAMTESITNSQTSGTSAAPVYDGGEMMYGGGFAQTGHGGLLEIGVTDDSTLNPLATEHLTSTLSKCFSYPDEYLTAGEPDNGFKVKNMWTGIMGFSIDALPWVGRLPPRSTRRNSQPNLTPIRTVRWSSSIRNHISRKPSMALPTADVGSEWVCGGYSGEGMVNAWGCGKALAIMIMGREQEEKLFDWFPEQMLISRERFGKGRLEDLVTFEDDENSEESESSSGGEDTVTTESPEDN